MILNAKSLLSTKTQVSAKTPFSRLGLDHDNIDPGLGLDQCRRPKRYFENSQEGFVKAWSKVVYAEEEDVFKHTWDLLCNEFSDQKRTFFPFFFESKTSPCSKLTTSWTALINYLSTTYLPWHHEFVVCYVKKYRNYGIQSSGRVESTYRTIKRHLKNRLASLDRLYEAIRTTSAAQRAEYLTVSAKQRQQVAAKHWAVCVFNDLICKISTKAMDIIWLQYRLAFIAYKRNNKTGDAYTGCKRVCNPGPNPNPLVANL
jgi:hypothetical protein